MKRYNKYCEAAKELLGGTDTVERLCLAKTDYGGCYCRESMYKGHAGHVKMARKQRKNEDISWRCHGILQYSSDR